MFFIQNTQVNASRSLITFMISKPYFAGIQIKIKANVIYELGIGTFEIFAVQYNIDISSMVWYFSNILTIMSASKGPNFVIMQKCPGRI